MRPELPGRQPAVVQQQSPPVVEDLVLFLADISGYTSFMKWNVETLVHSQAVITILLETILDRLPAGSEVSKLEGDAVFFYVRKRDPGPPPREEALATGRALASLWETFNRKVVELSRSRYCECDACRGIENLRVKFIVHAGKAAIHPVRHFVELAGLDVIVVHRLLKNSVGTREYALVTDGAAADVEFPPEWASCTSREECEGIGSVAARVYTPPGAAGGAAEVDSRLGYDRHPLATKVWHKARWTWRVFTAELLLRCGFSRRPAYRNVPPAEATAAVDPVLAVVMLVAAPITLPVLLVQNTLTVLQEHRDWARSASRGSSAQP
ncbi:MAG: DUF2652 domain-containing protein [Planctomycetes bacterium]|nr:DUF2652 domain-containing protein [Planctomycetota bacterium]